jgi:hypothetical protein
VTTVSDLVYPSDGGDHRAAVLDLLREAGYDPVLAGG